jgi:putative transposase
LKYLDESGFSLCLPLAYTWTLIGQNYQHRVRSRWGKQGRINLIGTLCLEGERQWLEYRMLEGSCCSAEVIEYLNALANQSQREEKSVVVVLDRASFHQAQVVKEERGRWEAKGLSLYDLPSYCPHLNLIEGVWRKVKGFLMPRRYYDTLAELREAVLHALSLLGAVEIQC